MKRDEPAVSVTPDGRVPADPSTDRFGKAHALLKRLGELQSGILVAVGVFYFFGYISWSLYAWQNKLGLLPAVEVQYLIGGFFYTFILGMGVLFITVTFWLLDWLLKKFKRIPGWPFDWQAELSGWKKWTRLLLTICLVVSVVVLIILSKTSLLEGYPTLKSRLMWVNGSIFIGYISLAMLSDKPRRSSSPWQILEEALSPFFIGYLKLIIIVVGFFGVAYAVAQYSTLPQSLGGFKSRCARLDVDRTLVSGDTLGALVPAEQISQPGPTPQTVAPTAGGAAAPPVEAPKPPNVLRSNTVQVLFHGNSSVILKADDNKIYEIERGVIKAVSWCD